MIAPATLASVASAGTEGDGRAPSGGGAAAGRTGVLIAVPWDQREGGVASVVGNLAETLRARGHPVVFLFPEEVRGVQRRTTAWGFPGYAVNLRPPHAPGHPVRAPAAFAATALEVWRRLASILREHHVGLANVHYPVEPFVHLALLRTLGGPPLVTSVHGSDLLPSGAARCPLPRSVALLLARSAAVVAPSAGYRDALAAAYPRLAGRVEVIHNGVDGAALSPAPPARPPASPYVLCLAHYAPWKGQDVLVRAFARLATIHPKLRLVCAGDGAGRAATAALAAELGVAARVELLDEQPRARVAELLHGCSLFVLPSRAESFGVALVEAMACGRPVVGTRVGGIPEVVTDGADGLLVPPGDPAALACAMERLLAAPATAEAMGRRARATVERRFLREHAGTAYAALFDAVLARTVPRGAGR